jgi:hypothetical protein
MGKEPLPVEKLSAAQIKSEARFVIYSPQVGIISEHTKASDAAVAFYEYAAKELKADVVSLPGIYKKAADGWVKV